MAAGADATLAGATELSRARDRVVHEAIAVVVQSVADLGGGRDQGRAEDEAAIADAATGDADARQARVAVLPDAETLVCGPVAIIVEPVAELV